MRALVFASILVLSAAACAPAASFADYTGVIRVFGDASNWMSTCFVVGDGSWVVTTCDSVTEHLGDKISQTIRYPIFISPYTGQAYQCELKASNKDLDVALLKLPVKGLPAAPLAQISEFAKAGAGTMGQLSSGEVAGNNWPTTIFGVSLQKSGTTSKLAVGEWSASRVFVCDIDKYKWAFVSDVKPADKIPNGSIVARETSVVGMYLNKLVVTGGKDNVVYGRCAMSSEIARYIGDSGVSTSTLYDPPRPTVAKAADGDAAFQLQSRIYSLIGAQKVAAALEAATAMVKMRPNDAQSHLVLGLAQMGSDKVDEALKSFDQAGKLDAKLPTLRMNRALALFAKKKKTEAEAELLKAAEEAPDDPRPVSALASFYLRDEKTLDKALSYAKQAAIMSPNSAAAELLIGKIQKSRKNYADAILAIGEALKLSPDWSEAWYALGATYEEGGDKTHAEKAYRTLVEKQPKDPDALLTLASFLADQGQKDEPLQLLGKLRALNPPKPVLDAAQTLQDKIEGKKPQKN